MPMLSTRVAANRIMAHMIPFFPDESSSFEVVEALIEAGISYLEIQFPFSDPTADGPVIEAACQDALRAGFTVDKGFAFVRSVSELCKREGVPMFVMTYASLVVARGVQRFVTDTRLAGADGLIVPDLPIDSDEGLYKAATEAGIVSIPVVVPGITQDRIELLKTVNPRFVYCALRAGITGDKTVLDDHNLGFLRSIASTGAEIFGGFGISAPEQIRALRGSVHAAVVGSALVKEIATVHESIPKRQSVAGSDGIYDTVKTITASLVGA